MKPTRLDLEFERMHSVPDIDGHTLYVEWTEVAPDSMEGRVHCECGWQSRGMKSCWFIQRANEHLGEAKSA